MKCPDWGRCVLAITSAVITILTMQSTGATSTFATAMVYFLFLYSADRPIDGPQIALNSRMGIGIVLNIGPSRGGSVNNQKSCSTLPRSQSCPQLEWRLCSWHGQGRPEAVDRDWLMLNGLWGAVDGLQDVRSGLCPRPACCWFLPHCVQPFKLQRAFSGYFHGNVKWFAPYDPVCTK